MDVNMTAKTRQKVVDTIRGELQSVIDNMESYIPDAIILEGATFVVEVDTLHFTKVKTNFEHLGRVPRGTMGMYIGSNTDITKDFPDVLDETELLLAHGLHFKVLEKDTGRMVLEVVT